MVRFVLGALLVVTLIACQGEQGPAGPSGTGAVSNRWCNKLTGTILLEYQVVRFASGDVEVICSITDVASEHTASTYYKVGDTGTTTGLCRLGYDFDVADGGYWDFRTDSPGERATYHDLTSTWDGTMVTFATTDCVG